jgi:2-polyprenyl-3-methyl-5-hydroxy-6-metoxy-1,4-benzoquinol methylase
MLSQIECQCCGLHRMKAIGHTGEYEQFSCESCGYVRFLHLSKEVDQRLYEADSDYKDDLVVATNYVDLIQWNHKQALKYLNRKFPSHEAEILDIGCFNGFFVKKILTYGFNATGIDFNDSALTFGKLHYGLEGRISNKTVQHLLAEGSQYDVVMLFEVIEHLEDFSSVLSDVYKLLKPDGILILSTPNSNMCWRPDLDFPPHHLSRFTPKALASCVIRLGFTPLISLEQTSTFDFIRNYVGSFFRHKDKKSMRGGEFRRKSLSIFLRRIANKSKRLWYFMLWPVDTLLHVIGIRYIGQMIISKK